LKTALAEAVQKGGLVWRTASGNGCWFSAAAKFLLIGFSDIAGLKHGRLHAQPPQSLFVRQVMNNLCGEERSGDLTGAQHAQQHVGLPTTPLRNISDFI
jgi:hypothetical protein